MSEPKERSLPENMKFALNDDGKLTITIDTTKLTGLSGTGKTYSMASTRGWVNLSHLGGECMGVIINTNILKKKRYVEGG